MRLNWHTHTADSDLLYCKDLEITYRWINVIEPHNRMMFFPDGSTSEKTTINRCVAYQYVYNALVLRTP